MEEILKKGLAYVLKNPSEFTRAYKLLYGGDVCSYCPGVIESKFKEVNKNRDNIKNMQERKYRMIPGKLIDTTMGDSKPWGQFTDKNMTDEIAEQLIGQGYSKYFVNAQVVEKPDIKIAEELEEKEQEAELKLEVFEKAKEGKNSLDTYSRTRLLDLCAKREYPSLEFKDLTRKELIKYINGK
jgi:hypothetical protein